MSDVTPPNVGDPATLAALQALLGQQLKQGQAPAVGGWNQPAPASAPAQILGVLVPFSVETPVGTVKVQLQFGPEQAASPQALLGLLEQLAAAGLPLDARKPKEEVGWNSYGGNRQGWNRSNTNSYGGNRGGYNGNNNGGWRR